MTDDPQITTNTIRHEHYLFRFDSIDKKLDKALGCIEKIDQYLFVGNGKPSLVSRITDIEKHCSSCILKKKEEADINKEKKKESDKRFWSIAILAISASFAILIPKIFLFIKFLATFL